MPSGKRVSPPLLPGLFTGDEPIHPGAYSGLVRRNGHTNGFSHVEQLEARRGGEKAKARDILAAIRTLKTIERESRTANAEERQTLARFGGFGPVALSIFSDPVTGRYKDGWQSFGETTAMRNTWPAGASGSCRSPSPGLRSE